MKKGDIYLVNLDPIIGHEQGGKKRPALILSNEDFNKCGLGMVCIVPCTTKFKGISTQVEVQLKEKSYLKCEDTRFISQKRLVRKLDQSVDQETLDNIELMLKDILNFKE